MASIGYARVSTEEQNLDLQIDALSQAGCSDIFEDRGVSAVCKQRPGLERAVMVLKRGDVFVIRKMDRAFRSLRHALDTLEDFECAGIRFRSLTDQIDTTTAMGKFVYQITNAFGELECNIISERTKAGMEAARKRGTVMGRPPKLSDDQIADSARRLAEYPCLTITALAKELDVSPRTLSRAIALFD